MASQAPFTSRAGADDEPRGKSAISKPEMRAGGLEEASRGLSYFWRTLTGLLDTVLHRPSYDVTTQWESYWFAKRPYREPIDGPCQSALPPDFRGEK